MFSRAGIRRTLLATVLAASLGLACGPLSAQKLYKWVDEKGETHYGDKIPPEYANKANEEMGKSGVILKRNEGQLTPEQQHARELAARKADEERHRQLEIQRRNKALLTTYNNVEEIDAAREKNLRQAEETIRGIQQKITDTQQQQVQLRKEADGYKGKKIPAALVESMDGAENDLRTNQQLVVSKRKELDSIRAKFDEERQVYLELSGGSGPK